MYATVHVHNMHMQALGKRLGPAMKVVSNEVKNMSSEAVLAMQVRGACIRSFFFFSVYAHSDNEQQGSAGHAGVYGASVCTNKFTSI